MSEELTPQYSDIIFYSSPEGNIYVEVIFNNETFWLSQKRMAELFGVEVHTVNYHLKEIFKSSELQEDTTIRKIRIVQKEGSRDVSRDVDFYNLDAIIAVGYRVNSYQATQFRIWATKTLKENKQAAPMELNTLFVFYATNSWLRWSRKKAKSV